MDSKNAKELRNKLLLLLIPLVLISTWFFHEMSGDSTGGGGGYDLTGLYFAFCLAGYTLFYLLVMFFWLLILRYQKKSTLTHTKCMLFGVLVAIVSFAHLAIILE